MKWAKLHSDGRLERLRTQRERQLRKWRGYLFIAIFLGLAALVCLSDPPTEPDPRLVNYCEMVRVHKNSPDPALGWPDYKGIYDAECR